MKAYVGDTVEDKPHKRNSVRLAIRKVKERIMGGEWRGVEWTKILFTIEVMYAPSKPGDQPSVEVSKEFMMSPNKLHLECSLDKELYYHGETISVNVHIQVNIQRF